MRTHIEDVDIAELDLRVSSTKDEDAIADRSECVAGAGSWDAAHELRPRPDGLLGQL